jgi:hypothetical protein
MGRGLMSITREELVGAFTPASFRFQREKRGNGGGDDADMRAPAVSERREREGYRFGFCGKLGRGLLLGLGRNVSPGSNSIFISSFLFFHFCFLYFFTPFSNLIQIDPNQLCKVSKIQNNHTEQ